MERCAAAGWRCRPSLLGPFWVLHGRFSTTPRCTSGDSSPTSSSPFRAIDPTKAEGFCCLFKQDEHANEYGDRHERDCGAEDE